VLNFSLALLGLISSEHLRLPPCSIGYCARKHTARQIPRFYTMTTYIIYDFRAKVNIFMKFSCKSF
jgi:hypothetical protein